MRASARAKTGALSALAGLVLLGHPAAAIVGDAETANWAIVRPALKLSGPRGVCSAAMVGRELVLTAAHCVTAVAATSGEPYCSALKQFDWATMGATCAAPGYKVAGPDSAWINVRQIVPHPEFDRDKKRGPDLAMVRLASPLPATLTPPLISTRPVRRGDRITIVGYGVDDSGKQDGIARMAALTVASTDRDSTFALVERPIAGTLVDRIATGERHKLLGGCRGDSGGPAFDLRLGAPLLVGIVFASNGCHGLTAVTAIHPYREWISDTAQRMGATLGP